jgi:hypothetical protein
MLNRLLRALSACWLLLASASAFAENTIIRTFPIAEHGSLQLSAPQSWPVQTRRAGERQGLTIAFGPQDADTYQVLITPMPRAGKSEQAAGAVVVKQMVQLAAADAQQQAVEKTITVKELRAGVHVGYYFSATDRAPLTGEYRYLTQGMFALGETVIAFTILTNDGYESVVPAALTMIRNAVELKGL